MEQLDTVLRDWSLLRPEGSTLPASQIEQVIVQARRCIQTTQGVSGLRRTDAYALLERQNGELPLLIRMLRIDFKESSPRIHFLRFWQAREELMRRLFEGFEGASQEPLLDEILAFRDTLLRHASNVSGVGLRWLQKEVSTAKSMSADQELWTLLQHEIGIPGGLNGPERSNRSVFAFCKSKLGKDAPQEELEEPVKEGEDALLSIEDTSWIVLDWLQTVAEDYCRGQRSAKIRAVRDVASCRVREACFHLGSRNWDVEAALLSHFAAAAAGTAAPPVHVSSGTYSWSSAGAKLRRSEVECPICVERYTEACPAVPASCCYQVLCSGCLARLTQPGGFQCPFCRSFAECDPTQARYNRWRHAAIRARSRPLETLSTAVRTVSHAAGQAASEATRLVRDMAQALRDNDEERHRGYTFR